MSVTVARKARKVRYCDGGRHRIEPGSVYLTHTALAGDDYYEDSYDTATMKPAKRPIRFNECADCATRYGRGDLIAARATP